ncbi:MAG: M24 family metallopeptidase [Oscillospiraceae bacterium]|nr:M24 family metallopeptidase [Oscillospiraceae bacterium]
MQEVFHERLKSPIPKAELERRNAALQKAMKAQGVDCIISQNLTQYMGGCNRWLTDTLAENNYPQSTILPADSEVRYIACSGPPLDLYPPPHLLRIGKPYDAAPYFSVFNFTNDWEGMFATRWIKENNAKKIGIPGFNMFQYNYYEYMEKNAPGVEFVDVAPIFDELRAIKSADEVKFIENSAKVLDKAMGYIIGYARPGINEFELRSKLMQIVTDHGGEEMVILMASAPRGEAMSPMPSFYQNRELEMGDSLYVNLKCSGPGGFFTTVGRMFSVGCEPCARMKSDFAQAVAAQEKLAAMLKPGAAPQDIFKKYNDYLASIGCKQEEGVFAYGQGYDHVERPSIQPGETMKLAESMCMSVNTSLVSECKSAFVADSFMIEAGGCRKLHKTPQVVFRT